jgi:type 1 glutamine amidotransferase
MDQYLPMMVLCPANEKMRSEEEMSWHRVSVKRLLMLALLVLVGCGAPELSVVVHPARDTGQVQSKIIFLAGPDSHLPGEHEHAAGSALLSEALRMRMPGLQTIDVYGGWPPDESIFDGAAAVVMYCDGGTSHLINDHLATFNRLVEAGVGVVALHYCVEVPKNSASARAMLNAIGGYFETWWSVNPTWIAEYTTLPDHPITDHIQSFSLKDEWYFNMRFIERGVTPILTATPPTSTMDRWDGPHSGNPAVRKMVSEGVPQVTAWAFERANGGRGFGYTGGHYHANWERAEPRELVLNAIEWVATKPTAPAP